MYTRRGHDWTLRFQTIANALANLPAKDLIVDGEAVVADSRGVPDFGLLHADNAAGRGVLVQMNGLGSWLCSST